MPVSRKTPPPGATFAGRVVYLGQGGALIPQCHLPPQYNYRRERGEQGAPPTSIGAPPDARALQQRRLGPLPRHAGSVTRRPRRPRRRRPIRRPRRRMGRSAFRQAAPLPAWRWFAVRFEQPELRLPIGEGVTCVQDALITVRLFCIENPQGRREKARRKQCLLRQVLAVPRAAAAHPRARPGRPCRLSEQA